MFFIPLKDGCNKQKIAPAFCRGDVFLNKQLEFFLGGAEIRKNLFQRKLEGLFISKCSLLMSHFFLHCIILIQLKEAMSSLVQKDSQENPFKYFFSDFF